jgi:hypothetical protein
MQLRFPAPAALRYVTAVLLLAASAAFATPQVHSATGLWINPDESGWGLNLFHQGDTLFGALFVYGADGRPRWYVASSLVSANDGPVHDRPGPYTGALYEASGPWFGGPFDPAKVTRRQAGTMRVDVGDNTGNVQYTIDGVTVSKQIRPFTFRGIDLSGDYVGYLYQPQTTAGPEVRSAVQMSLQDNGSSLHIAQPGAGAASCTYDGARGHEGQVSTASGTFTSCGAGASGPFTMAVDMTPDGFTGFFTGNGLKAPWGRIAMSRVNAGLHEGNGWRTDLWFPPDESGWGVNIVEQGDTIFATLFVYDAQGASHWYVASALTRSAPRADGTFTFAGPLFEATGPYFGRAFNPNLVTRRQVGTMTLDLLNRATALLSYTADGVAVTKTVSRFALRKNSLSGTYLGHLAGSEDDPGGASSEAMSIAIDDGDASFVMRTQPQGAPHLRSGASCTYTAPPALQYGEQRAVNGTYTCANGDSGNFAMQNAFATFNGFTATFLGAWVTKGHMEGVRQVAVPPKFSFVAGGAAVAPNAEGHLSIQRSGGTAGSFDVNYAFSGSGCIGGSEGGSVRFGDGDAGTKTISIVMGSSGECMVSLIQPASPAELASPTSAIVTVVPVVAGCPVPTNVVTAGLNGIGNPLLQRQASGQTVFIPLPATSPGRSSGSITFSESAGGAFTPQPVQLEISIDKCPGIIDTDTADFCNLRSTNGNFNSITFVSQATQTVNRDNAAQFGYCWAGDGGQYYVNARWTYPACASGVELCGFAIQFNDGPF